MKIQEIIDKSIADERAKPHEHSGKFKPSSFGFCYRRQWWERKGEPQTNPPDDRSFRVFKCGHLFEDFVTNATTKELPNAQLQVEIKDDNFHGYADMVNEDTVYEFKSQHSNSFWYVAKALKAGKSIVDEKIHNFLQAGFYAMKLGKDFVCLVFISKDDLCINQFKVSMGVLGDKVQKEIDTLLFFWEHGKLPPPEPRLFWVDKKTLKSKECEIYCPFRDRCYKLQKENNETIIA